MSEHEIAEVKTAEKKVPESSMLDNESDNALRAMIAQAQAIIDSRATERRRSALAEIRRLARENGLSVNVKKPARKRGRPRKAVNES